MYDDLHQHVQHYTFKLYRLRSVDPCQSQQPELANWKRQLPLTTIPPPSPHHSVSQESSINTAKFQTCLSLACMTRSAPWTTAKPRPSATPHHGFRGIRARNSMCGVERNVLVALLGCASGSHLPSSCDATLLRPTRIIIR